MNISGQALPKVEVIVHRDPARLAALRDAWRELFDAAGQPNPFLSWEWQYRFWLFFGQGRSLWTFEVREVMGEGAGAALGRLVGVLVLQGRGVLPARRLGLLTNGLTGTDALDVLSRPGYGEAVRTGVAQSLVEAIPDWDVLDLEDLPRESATLEVLQKVMIARGVHCALEPRFVCPMFPVSGTFETRLSGFKRRETYLRRRRWFERQSGFECRVATSPAEAASAMEDLLRLHGLRWDSEGGSSGIPRGPIEAFHRELAPVLAERGWLRIYRLFIGGQVVAAVYGLELGGRFYYYQSGMDPAWTARSPGLVLIGKTIEDAYARGLEHYDFLRGSEPHKLEWAEARRETCALHLRAPGLRSEASAAAEELFRHARGAARAIASERMWSVLQGWRRNITVGWLARSGGR